MVTEILTTGENELGYFPFVCELDSKEEADNEEAWHKANPSMEFMPILANQIKKDYLEMKKLPSKMPEFFTKRLNLPRRCISGLPRSKTTCGGQAEMLF